MHDAYVLDMFRSSRRQDEDDGGPEAGPSDKGRQAAASNDPGRSRRAWPRRILLVQSLCAPCQPRRRHPRRPVRPAFSCAGSRRTVALQWLRRARRGKPARMAAARPSGTARLKVSPAFPNLRITWNCINTSDAGQASLAPSPALSLLKRRSRRSKPDLRPTPWIALPQARK